jgi:hypothetical protein
MIFGIFGNPKLPPLTTTCIKLSAPEKMAASVFKFAERERDLRTTMDPRPLFLCAIIMAAAGYYVGRLRWERAAGWEGSRRFLQNTNIDVITAEAIIWITFLMGRFIRNEEDTDQEELGHARGI